MSYPQQSSNAPVIRNENFWRFSTEIISAGDIYRSEQGGTFSIGPDSDISRFKIAYWDEFVPNTFMNHATAEVGRPFSMDVVPRLDRQYEPSKQPGTIFMWSDQLWDPSPLLADTDAYPGLLVVAPQLDIIQSFSKNLNLTSKRPDKKYVISGGSLSTAPASGWWLLPCYGRRRVTITPLAPVGGVAPDDFNINGVNFEISRSSTTPILAPVTPFLDFLVDDPGKVTLTLTLAGYDALLFKMTTAMSNFTVTFSDEV